MASKEKKADPQVFTPAVALSLPIVQRLLLVCGVVGPVLFTAVYLIDGALHPGYDLLRRTISDLELVSGGWLQAANFITFGLLVVGFAAGLRKALAEGISATLVPILEGFVALGLIGDGIFWYNPLHAIFDFVTFISAVIASFIMAGRFAGDPKWRGWTLYSIGTGILTMALLAVFGRTLALNGPAGLLERLAALVRSLWTLLFAARLLAGTPLLPRRARWQRIAPASTTVHEA